MTRWWVAWGYKAASNESQPQKPRCLPPCWQSSFQIVKCLHNVGHLTPSLQVHLTPGIKVSSTMGPQDKMTPWNEIMDIRDWCRAQLHWNPWWHIYRTRSGWKQGERNSNSNCSQRNEEADWLNAGQMVTVKNTTAQLPKWDVGSNCQR